MHLPHKSIKLKKVTLIKTFTEVYGLFHNNQTLVNIFFYKLSNIHVE